MVTRCVIWDWNGTILNDTALCYEIANDMRARRGMPTMANVEEYRNVFGFPIVEYYRRMGYTFERESYEDISVEFVAEYRRRVPGCPLQAHILETLAAVKSRGIPQILLSATEQERLMEQTALYDGFTGYFSRIVGMTDNLAHGKAALACACAAQTGFPPENILFVGDTDHDYEVATAAGCRCVLVTNGHQPREKLEKCGVPLLATQSEVLRYL